MLIVKQFNKAFHNYNVYIIYGSKLHLKLSIDGGAKIYITITNQIDGSSVFYYKIINYSSSSCLKMSPCCQVFRVLKASNQFSFLSCLFSG